MRLRWIGSVGCEGGPVLVTDVEAYPEWTGAEPVIAGQTTVHLWGQFTGELPDRFRPQGPVGHQYLEHDSHVEAVATLRELEQVVHERWPDTHIDAGPVHSTYVRGDDRQLRAELAPSSAYDGACMAGRSADAWTHGFGRGRHAMFWQLSGGGIADVAITDERTELVLLRSWLDDPADEVSVRSLVDDRHPDEEPGPEIDLPSGIAAVVWAPVPFAQIEGVRSSGDLASLADREPAAELENDFITGLGTVVRLAPGRYRGATCSHEDRRVAARWCRLIRVAPG